MYRRPSPRTLSAYTRPGKTRLTVSLIGEFQVSEVQAALTLELRYDLPVLVLDLRRSRVEGDLDAWVRVTYLTHRVKRSADFSHLHHRSEGAVGF